MGENRATISYRATPPDSNDFRPMTATVPLSTLTLDEIISVLRHHADDLRSRGVSAVAIFGSRARGDNRPDSDLDLLIDYDRSRKFSLLDQIAAEHFVQDIVGCEVRMTSRTDLRADRLGPVEANSIMVF